MNNIKDYLDSTYLDTPQKANISVEQYTEIAHGFIQEAIVERFKLIMIRPDMVSDARMMIDQQGSKVLVGTVIGFHEGTYSLEEKSKEAQAAILNGADELDFVVNFEKFKLGEVKYVSNEVTKLTELSLRAGKVVKWIIEVAALTDEQIANISKLIRDIVVEKFPNDVQKVFLKSSTGFYKTEGGKPAGATFHAMEIMKKYGSPLPLKAAGGVRDLETARKMIELGVSRIGTSSAKKLADGNQTGTSY